MPENPKQAPERHTRLYIVVAMAWIVGFLMGIGLIIGVNSVNHWSEFQAELTFQMQWTQTLHAMATYQGTRQSQIEESATAAIHNETATAEASVTQSP